MVNEELIKFIFLFLLGTTVLNLGIAIAARLKSRHKEFNKLILYWTSLFLTYFAAAILKNNPTEIIFAFYVQCIPAFLIAQILSNSRGLKFSWTYYMSLQLVGMLASTYLALYTDVGFTLSIIPVVLSTAQPFWRPSWNSLISERKNSNWIEKALSIVFLTGILNHFNYAFFRLDPSTAFWGWSLSILQYQCLSIFLPMMISHRQEENEIKNLQLTLEKITGQNIYSTKKVSELYEQLESQIEAKENALNQLTTSNTRLEEERKINEILIKTISHDFANPLTVVKVYLDMIQSGRVPSEDTKKILDRMGSNIKNAFDMIARIKNAILNRSQASLGIVENVSLDEALVDIQSLYESRLSEKEIKLLINNELPVGTEVLAEKSALVDHILSNVISNAIKFSYRNSKIEVNITEDHSKVKLEVRDFGMGIPKDVLNRSVLQSTPGTLGETGTGFGLVVMGYFVRSFGATMEIVSHTAEVDRGTSIIIHFEKASSQAIFNQAQDKSPSANLFS